MDAEVEERYEPYGWNDDGGGGLSSSLSTEAVELSRAGRDAPSPEEPFDFELALFIEALLETGAAALDRDLARVLMPSSASPSS